MSIRCLHLYYAHLAWLERQHNATTFKQLYILHHFCFRISTVAVKRLWLPIVEAFRYKIDYKIMYVYLLVVLLVLELHVQQPPKAQRKQSGNKKQILEWFYSRVLREVSWTYKVFHPRSAIIKVITEEKSGLSHFILTFTSLKIVVLQMEVTPKKKQVHLLAEWQLTVNLVLVQLIVMSPTKGNESTKHSKMWVLRWIAAFLFFMLLPYYSRKLVRESGQA